MSKSISLGDKIARFRAFWTRADVDRPLIGATINPIPSVRAIRREGVLRPEDLDLEESLRELDEEWEQWREASGDAVWAASPLWAFHWLTAMAGCPNLRGGEIVWNEPSLHDWSQLDTIRFDKANPWFQRLVEFIHALVAHSAGRYPIAAASLAGAADLMMHLRGPERLALDLYDYPEQVDQLSKLCVDFSTSAISAVYEAIPSYMGGYAGTIRYFWAPDKLVETSEDLTIIMSPTAHQRYVVPIHRALCQQIPYTILHLHSANLRTVPYLLDIDEIKAIEITPDFGADMIPHIPLMAQILERKPLIVHGVMTPEAMKKLMASLPWRGLCLFCRCNSAAEGAAVLREVL